MVNLKKIIWIYILIYIQIRVSHSKKIKIKIIFVRKILFYVLNQQKLSNKLYIYIYLYIVDKDIGNRDNMDTYNVV